MKNNAELVFIPAPGVGHLAPMVELAKVLTVRDHRISITVFIMDHPLNTKLNLYTQNLLSNPPPPHVRFVHLLLDETDSENLRSMHRGRIIHELVKIHKPQVKECLSSDSMKSARLAGFVVDMFCMSFIELAIEFGVPTYVFFTSSVGTLNLLFHLQSLHDEENCDILEFQDSNAELGVPGFVRPVPAKVLPSVVFEKDSSGTLSFVNIPRTLSKVKGILVNTFADLEPHGIDSLSNNTGIPRIHVVGPVLNLKSEENNDAADFSKYENIMSWLNTQPPASVVFLCFGSMGTFETEQVVEIASGLEQSRHRFLWSLRRAPPKGKFEIPTEYDDFNDVLPEGFLDRTKGIGKVIGWAPQIAVLSHPAVGGFVSHCGWNSILESFWFGVPVATWPLYAEQQMNAFQMVKDLGLAVEIKLDYRKDDPMTITAEVIKEAIKRLMEGSNSKEIRKKVKEMSKKSRMTVAEDGSSYASVGHFIEEVLSNSS